MHTYSFIYVSSKSTLTIPIMWALSFSRHFAATHSNKLIAREAVSSCLTKDEPIEKCYSVLVLEFKNIIQKQLNSLSPSMFLKEQPRAAYQPQCKCRNTMKTQIRALIFYANRTRYEGKLHHHNFLDTHGWALKCPWRGPYSEFTSSKLVIYHWKCLAF